VLTGRERGKAGMISTSVAKDELTRIDLFMRPR